MKQFKFSVLFVSMICILIGYFEPANAAVISKSITKKVSTTSDAYAILNTTSGFCPFFPNPISPDEAIVVAYDNASTIGSVSVTGLSGTIENNIYIPATIENNILIEPKIASSYFGNETTVTGSRCIFSTLPAGEYVLTVKMTSGVTYTSKFVVAS